jgi:hypothetical protein
MSQSQLSQSSLSSQDSQDLLPLGQKRSAPTYTGLGMIEALKSFNAKLIVKNNLDSEDLGVATVITALDHDDQTKRTTAIRNAKIKKEHLLAAYAFLKDIPLSEAKITFKKAKVDELRSAILDKYVAMAPGECHNCDRVFDVFAEDRTSCFSCRKGLCSSCCPDTPSIQSYTVPICTSCLSIYKFREPFCQEESSPDSQPSQETVSTPLTDFTIEQDGGSQQQSSPTPAGPSSVVVAKNLKTTDCSFFLKNQCKFGMAGKDCPFKHPTRCWKWLKSGLKGCSKGKECLHAHPKLCPGSVRERLCTKDDCRLPHLPKTARTAPINDAVTKVTPTTIPTAATATAGPVVPQPGRKAHPTAIVPEGFQEASQSKAPDQQDKMDVLLTSINSLILFLTQERRQAALTQPPQSHYQYQPQYQYQ